MALSNAIKGAKRPSQPITWTRGDASNTPEDLTGATITATIRRAGTTTSEALTGTFVVTDGAAGEFRWDYSSADVAAEGAHQVQFTATFGSNPTPAKTMIEAWFVEDSL